MKSQVRVPYRRPHFGMVAALAAVRFMVMHEDRRTMLIQKMRNTKRRRDHLVIFIASASILLAATILLATYVEFHSHGGAF